MGIAPFVVPSLYPTIESAVQAAASSNSTVKDVIVTSGTYTFNTGYILPDGINISFSTGVIINLTNNGFIKTTGTGKIYDDSATWNPKSIRITKNGSTIGRYPDLTTAYNNWNGNETLEILSGTHTISQEVTIPYGVTVHIQPGVTVNFSGITIMGRLEMQQGTKINSNYIAITGSSGTFTTSGTSNVPNNVNIFNYGVLDIGGFLNGKYTNFNFGIGS